MKKQSPVEFTDGSCVICERRQRDNGHAEVLAAYLGACLITAGTNNCYELHKSRAAEGASTTFVCIPRCASNHSSFSVWNAARGDAACPPSSRKGAPNTTHTHVLFATPFLPNMPRVPFRIAMWPFSPLAPDPCKSQLNSTKARLKTRSESCPFHPAAATGRCYSLFRRGCFGASITGRHARTQTNSQARALREKAFCKQLCRGVTT